MISCQLTCLRWKWLIPLHSKRKRYHLVPVAAHKHYPSMVLDDCEGNPWLKSKRSPDDLPWVAGGGVRIHIAKSGEKIDLETVQ